MKILFWGKYISFHQLDTFGFLEQNLDEPLIYALIDNINKKRMKQGWNPVNIEGNTVYCINNKDFFKNSIKLIKKYPDSIHLFLSLWGHKGLFFVLLYALWKKKKVMILLEPYSSSPYGYWREEGKIISYIKVILRKVVYRLSWPIILAASKGKPPCILAISQIAVEQLTCAGYCKKNIFPYGYFINKKNIKTINREPDDYLHVIYSGSILKIKGIDIVIDAIRYINNEKIRVLLDIYGSGDISNYNIKKEQGIKYLGTYKPENAQEIISQYDLLIVPSRHEGWGVVVNEAIMQGIPVMVSDRVGAKCLIENSGAGLLFKSGDTKQLADLLIQLYNNRSQLNEMKIKCKMVDKKITPIVGAMYLKKTIHHYFYNNGYRPIPIWLNSIERIGYD